MPPTRTTRASDEDVAKVIEALHGAEVVEVSGEVPPIAPAPAALPVDAAAADAGQSFGAVAQLVAMVERLLERVDKGDRASAELMQQVLAQHGSVLRQTLSPENKLHPDVSDYNPDGERDHPRPRLTRPCYFLNVPLEQQTLTKSEILLLNRVTKPLEHPNRDKHWRIAFLNDGGGGSALYISVPYKGMDDVRALPGGWQGVVEELLEGGTTPVGSDALLARLERLEKLLADAGTDVPPL